MKHRILMAAALACAALARPAAAQLSYDGTYFLHGLGDPGRWSDKNIPPQLTRGVDLGSRTVMTQSSALESVDTQSRQVRSQLLWYGGRDVLVGHSMGGVVARNLVLSGDGTINTAGRVAGIVAVGSPLRGAPISDNSLKFDPVTGGQLVEGFFSTLGSFKVGGLAGLLDVLGAAVVNTFVQNLIENGIKQVVGRTFGAANSPGAQNLKTSSPTIQRLQVADNLPHASVYGMTPKKNAPWHLLGGKNYDPNMGRSYIRTKDVLNGAAYVCKTIFYNIIVKTSTGRACHVAHRTISSIDSRWSDWTHGPNKNAPFDAFIPQDHSVYPGTTVSSPVNIGVNGPNHFSLVWETRGQDGIIQGMRYIGMRPPPSTTPTEPTNPGGGWGGCSDPRQIICEDNYMH